MLKKWFEIVSDHKVSLRERMYRIVTVICMVALICILPMGKNIWNILLLAASLIAMSMIVKFSIRKGCINCGATAISVMLLLIFPVSFFTAGCRNGSCSVLSISVLPLRGGGWQYFSGCVRRRRSFVIMLLIISRI